MKRPARAVRQPASGQGAEARAELAALRSVQAVLELDSERRILDANANFLGLLGYALPELTGQPFELLSSPAWRESAEYRALWSELERGHAATGVHRFQRKDGASIFLRGAYAPVAMAGRAVKKIVVHAQDVTAQRTEAALHASTMAGINRVRAVAEFDLDGRFLSINEVFQQRFGYTPDDVRGRELSVVLPPAEQASDHYRSLWQRIRAGQFEAGEFRWQAADGRPVWVQGYFTPVCDLEGKPVRAILFVTDVTAQKTVALGALRIQRALDHVSANIMLTDSDDRIVYASRSLQQLLERCAPQLRLTVPGFDSLNLLGQTLDRLPGNSAAPQPLLASLQSSHHSTLDAASLQLRLLANPVVEADGNRVGTIIEWIDRTQESRIEDEVAEIATAAERGDLTKRIRMDDKQGVFASLGGSVNGLIDNTRNLVHEIKLAADAVQRGALEISTGNQNLARRTERTASSLEQTASSMEQMTASVKLTADNAGQANRLALAARQQAEKGGDVVGAAVSAMSGINASSKKIADIIGVIDEIAFQTNLLALNAAVEAARAGEQGRGFAVVATEVRNLAGRSATAAKEIKALIRDSVAKVDEGSRLVDESGRTLAEIVGAVKKVTDIVADIAAASREQSMGIEQVNRAVMDMDSTTQQNAALVQQATGASAAIVETAHALAQRIACFHLGEVPAALIAATPAMAPRASAAATPERRAAERPWSRPTPPAKPAAKPAAAKPTAPAVPAADMSARAAPPPARRAVAVQEDSEWKEF